MIMSCLQLLLIAKLSPPTIMANEYSYYKPQTSCSPPHLTFTQKDELDGLKPLIILLFILSGDLVMPL